jgi:trigger factor
MAENPREAQGAAVEVQVQETGTWERTLDVTVPAERVRATVEELLRDLQKRVRIPGFRPGKAPRGLLLQRFRATLENDLVERLLPRVLWEALEQAKLETVGDPEVTQLRARLEEPMTFRAVVEIWPRVEVTGYEDLELEQEIEAVTEEHVRKALDDLRMSRATEVPVDRPSIAGDILEGELEPVDVQGRRLPNLEVRRVRFEVGAETLLPEFREASLGIAAGGERFVEVQYPEDYPQEELRGQKRRYRLKVREIREKKPRPLDDDFARELDPELDLEKLRERVRRSLEAEVQREARRRLEETIVDRLIQRNPFELPRRMLQRGLERLARRFQQEGRQVSSEELETTYRPLVERLQRRQILLAAVAEKEGLAVTDDELRQHLERMAEENRMSVERLRAILEARGELGRLKEDLQERKVLDFLVSKAKVHQFVRSGPEGEKVSKGGIILP